MVTILDSDEVPESNARMGPTIGSILANGSYYRSIHSIEAMNGLLFRFIRNKIVMI